MIKQITERFTPRQYLAELLLGLTALLGLYLIIAWSSGILPYISLNFSSFLVAYCLSVPICYRHFHEVLLL